MKEEEKKQSLSQEAYDELAELLGKIDLSDVSANSTGKKQEYDGYYLCEVVNAELTTSKSSGKTQVKVTLKAVENCLSLKDNDDSDIIEYESIEGSKGTMFYKYYPLVEEKDLKRFVSDMLKFESEPGVSILPKEAFLRPDTLEDALSVLVDMQLYVQVDNKRDENGTVTNTWYSLVSWSKANELELPVE